MKIAYDVTLRRPGCAIVQAGLGGDIGIANYFPAETWVTRLTPGMKLYEVTTDQLDRLVAMSR